MKAITLNEAGGTENLKYTEAPIPVINNNEVLVKVKAISINPVDVKARAYDTVLSWIYGSERPVILGWDIAGEIVQTGSAVSSLHVGEQVFGMVNFFGNGKAYAEYVAVPEMQLAIKPHNITYEEAAAATLTALTAWQALVENARIKKGDRVLIHGSSGGVGNYAVQIAKHFGAYVIGTSSERNKDFVLSLGADKHVDYSSKTALEEITDVDLVLDTIGGDVLLNSIDMVKSNGRVISLPSHEIPEEAKEKAKKRNVELSFILVQSNGNNMKCIADLLEKRILKSHICASFLFTEMDKAHVKVETGGTVGKVIVKV